MLDPAFQFSQHSLSDFADCPRRFYLRYVARQPWPLLESSAIGMDALSYQGYLRRGALLHRWIERYWLGINTSEETSPLRQTDDPELAIWWSRFLANDFADSLRSDLPALKLPELELVAPLGEFRLYARFDLLAITPHSASSFAPSSFDFAQDSPRAIIVDWKTLRGENAPSYQFLKQRMQTRVYLYVLATAGAPFNDGVPFEPEQCVMRYWLANFPERPWVEITYSRAEYEADKTRLLAWVNDIARREGEAQFEKTSDERKCTYCNFRTLCHRVGESGASLPDEEEEMKIMDASNVPELEY